MSSMRQTAASLYDIDELLQRLPADRGQLVIGFVPWPEDCQGWLRAAREDLSGRSAAPLTRTIWDDPDNRDARVLIDVVECRSAADAVRALTEILSGNQLGRLPEGPEGVGEMAFTHPDNVPPAVFFVRGNLSLVVASFGKSRVPVTDWARRIDNRLLDRPTISHPASILRSSAGDAPRAAGADIEVTFDLPWRLHEDGFLNVFVDGGFAELTSDTTFVVRPAAGQARVEAILAEPGRPVFGDRLSVEGT